LDFVFASAVPNNNATPKTNNAAALSLFAIIALKSFQRFTPVFSFVLLRIKLETR
jgi:hypothetical protein